ncbi:hypothetical protein MLGJGCBP_01448 [Rhodococcus sp. T7]|nr:hypothetical protein MLGJGCBP_01448 [Rhodococcus sp. T7]
MAKQQRVPPKFVRGGTLFCKVHVPCRLAPRSPIAIGGSVYDPTDPIGRLLFTTLSDDRRVRAAWSKGGTSDLANCETLCVLHNRSKGNR